jgi:hypothetical protein
MSAIEVDTEESEYKLQQVEDCDASGSGYNSQAELVGNADNA